MARALAALDDNSNRPLPDVAASKRIPKLPVDATDSASSDLWIHLLLGRKLFDRAAAEVLLSLPSTSRIGEFKVRYVIQFYLCSAVYRIALRRTPWTLSYHLDFLHGLRQ